MNYDLDMQLKYILEDAECTEAFDRILPGVRNMFSQRQEAMGLSVRNIAAYSNGLISQSALDALESELKEIGARNKGISPAERARMAEYQAMWEADQKREKPAARHYQEAVYPGRTWLDVHGERIQAHAGGFLYENGTYYWYGENKEHTDGRSNIWTWGIRLYASEDFYNWENRGLIIPPVLDDPNSELYPEKRVDRPHIVRNPNTGKYVCWFKNSGPESCFNVMTSDTLFGPWQMENSRLNPYGLHIGDFDLVIDEETGNAYIYCEAEHRKCTGFRLNRDYTDVEALVSCQYEGIDPPFTREGQSVCQRSGRLWMLTSGMTGYIPNQSDSAVSEGFEQPFTSIGDPHVNDESLSSFNSQIGQIFKVPGKKDLYLAVADRWVPEYPVDRERAMVLRRAVASRYYKEYEASETDRAELAASPNLDTANTSIADYVILPIDWSDGAPKIRWVDSWKLEDFE